MVDETSKRHDVLLVSMPFGPFYQPSIGLSLLKASLDGGIRCKVLYFQFQCAELLGGSLYDWIADGKPSVTALVGEWIFSPALFDPVDEDGVVRRYVDEVLRGGEAHGDPVAEDLIAELLRARRLVPGFLDNCVEQVLQHRPRIVGFTSVFQQQLASLGLARRLREADPNLFIVFGGANCEGPMGLELMRQFGFVDAVVCGEGDLVFRALVDRVLEHRPVTDLPGVYTRTSLPVGDASPRNAPYVERMDELPYPDYGDFFEQWHACSVTESESPRIPFETARGCWWGEKHHCTFCGLNGSGMAFRSKSAERALEELLHLTNRFPRCPVVAVDNILDMAYFKSFIPTLVERQLDFKLFYEVKANLKKDQVRLLREAGIDQIQPGIESLSDDVLGLMRKGVRGLQNIQLLKWCKQLGVRAYWNFLWGFPGESAAEYARMAEWIPLLVHLAPPDRGVPVRVDRFSPMFDRSREWRLGDPAPCPAYRYVYPFERDTLANLAYYFTFEEEHETAVAAYTEPLRAGIAEWQRVHPESELIGLDNGNELRLVDLRPTASNTVTEVTGLQRALYLACDGIMSVRALVDVASRYLTKNADVEDIETALRPLLKEGLMLRQGDLVIGLATNAVASS